MYVALPLVCYAVTPLHVGAGRGTVVDLTVQRDIMKFPVIMATSLKGPLKSLTFKNPELSVVVELFGKDIDLERYRDVVEESKIHLLDAYLLAVPVKVDRELLVYVTCPYLLKKILNILEPCIDTSTNAKSLYNILKRIYEECSTILDSDPDAVIHVPSLQGRVSYLSVGDKVLRQSVFRTLTSLTSSDIETLKNILGVLGYPALTLPDRLVLLSDLNARLLIEEGIVKVTRVAIGRPIETKTIPEAHVLDYSLKTVRRGGLWTEEYLPAYTIFMSCLVVSREVLNSAGFEKLKEYLSKGLYLFVGGKETIGKGLMKLLLLT